MIENIQAAYIKAMKEKDEVGKRALSMLKASIINKGKEKNEGLSDDDINKVIASELKKRQDSLKIYQDQGRDDLAKVEQEDIDIISRFMPTQLSYDELKAACKMNLLGIPDTLPYNAKKGKTIGWLNKKFPGKFDTKTAIEIIEDILQ